MSDTTITPIVAARWLAAVSTSYLAYTAHEPEAEYGIADVLQSDYIE